MTEVTKAMLLDEVLKIRAPFDENIVMMKSLSRETKEVQALTATFARESREAVNEMRERRRLRNLGKREPWIRCWIYGPKGVS